MAALTAGTKAPDFELKAMDGKRFVLRDELLSGPVVLAFFKVSCPICQYAFRSWSDWSGRTGTRASGSSASRRTIPEQTAAFTKEFGVTFPVLLDDTETIPCRTHTA